MLSPLQLELTKLIGKKELSLGTLFSYFSHETKKREYAHWNCQTMMELSLGEVYFDGKDMGNDIEILGNKATLSDLHRWMNENKGFFEMTQTFIRWGFSKDKTVTYDSSKELLEQSEETLKQIEELIRNNQ